MSHRTDGHEYRQDDGHDFAACDHGSRLVFGAFWVLLFAGNFLVAGPWAGFHGVLLACVGLLMWLSPPVVALPRHWWLLAAIFVLAGAGAFLPAKWLAMPEWRLQLAALGIETGSLVTIQARQAVEMFAMFAIMLGTGLWLAGHRASPSQVRLWALAFAVGVAAYAIFARVIQEVPPGGEAHFGFFPNRNHTATYLAMGTICGLGNVLQALRDKRFFVMVIALVATGVCLWAVAGWSVSRGGVVLVVIGSLGWLAMLGRRYLGRHGLWAIGLMALAGAGLFFIVDSGVKARLTKTVERTGVAINPADAVATGQGSPAMGSILGLDFRIPTALDTLGLIREFPWTGIGAGQYYYIFPQYRHRTAVSNDADNFHPESDWLWMAAEAGLPATLALLVLVILAFWKSRGAILRGRDRGLRSACLVAALLVPIHGLFDVPGHRITLAWSAAFLFALSLPVPSADSIPASPRKWPFRVAALFLLLAAAFLIRAQWWGGPQPALTTAATALTGAKRLYQEDQALLQTAVAKGQPYQPAPAEDRLEKALALLTQATPVAPLDRDLLRYEAFLAFHFDDQYDRVDRSFARERALDPTWIECPLRQAETWAPIDPQRTAALWTEALGRAGKLDRLQPGSPSSSERTLQRIRQFAKGRPGFEKLLPVPQSPGNGFQPAE